MKITTIGTGRAGSSFALALRRAGHEVTTRRHDQLDDLAAPALILLCVPDDALREVAARLPRSPSYVVAHVAGSRGLDELAGHARVGLMHPLAVLSSPEVGARRLARALYSVAGDELIETVVSSLGGRTIHLRDEQRPLYHATATVAANHSVALLGHVAALATSADLALEDFLPLVVQALEDVTAVGAASALTGPASRADMATIDAHLAAMPASQRSTYVALANAAFELAEARKANASR